MSRRRFGRWIAVLVASAVAIVAPVPMLTPMAEAAEPAVPASYLNQPISWGSCSGDLDSKCAKVKVPRDWTNPAKGSISIAIAYLKASGTSKGLLTTNPGGPGTAGRTFTEALSWSKPQLRQYDLLGFDPRGFGASTNVKCVTTTAKYNKLPKVADPRSRTKKTHAVEVAEAKLFAEACSSDPLPGYVSARYVNTQQTVWDLDFLRQLLDAKNTDRSYPVLNYIGYSYGTWLGAWYADTYPKNVGRFILDSNMQWTASMYTNQTLDPRSFQRRRDKMLFPYLARHNADFGLGKSAKSVKKKYESTRKKLVTQAKKALKKGKTPALGPEDFDYTVSQYIYTDAGFDYAGAIVDAAADYVRKPSSAKYRKTLAKRVKAPMTKAPFSVQRTAKAVSSARKDITQGLAGGVVRCNDSANSSNIKALLKRADSDARKYPFVGYLNTVELCAYWKFKPQTRTIDLAGVSNKILMFQSEGDPATAYEGALAAHRRTAGKTVMVSVDNEGQHGLYVDGPSKCIESLGDSFLFKGWRPTADRKCTTSPLAYDRKVYTLSGPVSGAKSTAKKVVKPKNGTVKAVRADAAKRGLS
ncbi:MAG TPA: alpha/beta hydrolase [Microlunatus sp.]|jgi:pimeloyl-ACP methyl ester carboxylesterase|nr:alpha/beta hydrolase [Microlunatus sp.]